MRKLWVTSMLVAASAVTACSSSPSGQGISVDMRSDSGGAPVAGCRAIPTSTGPIVDAAQLTITAPRSAQAGQDLPISAQVVVSQDMQRVISTPATSAVLIVRGDQVVGMSEGNRSGAGIPLILRAGSRRPGQAVPGSVRLTTCEGGMPPQSLPAGEYALVGVLGYRLDPLNAAVDGAAPRSQDFALISEPVTISVD